MEHKARLKLAYTCKNSARFNAVDVHSKKIVTSIYLSNDTYEKLNKPKEINITIEAVE